jgi:hypothetical protein
MVHAGDDRLEALWLRANHDDQSEKAFLYALSSQRVSTILRKPPGPNEAAPERNLVQWGRETDGIAFVPIFTSSTHLRFVLPPLAQFVSVPMRVLLAAGGNQTYIVNPLSESRFELQARRLALLHRYIAEAHHDSEWPSRHAPWIFRLPDDALFPVAVKLAEWFNSSGRVDQAFLYELTRGQEPRTDVVLGVNEPSDRALADMLRTIAIDAGLNGESFIVRFLPDEPSHREGLTQAGLTPFYQRPGTTRRWD